MDSWGSSETGAAGMPVLRNAGMLGNRGCLYDSIAMRLKEVDNSR